MARCSGKTLHLPGKLPATNGGRSFIRLIKQLRSGRFSELLRSILFFPSIRVVFPASSFAPGSLRLTSQPDRFGFEPARCLSNTVFCLKKQCPLWARRVRLVYVAGHRRHVCRRRQRCRQRTAQRVVRSILPGLPGPSCLTTHRLVTC